MPTNTQHGPFTSRRATNKFADIAKNIGEVVGQNANDLAYEIYLSVFRESPVDTGVLQANWNYGVTTVATNKRQPEKSYKLRSKKEGGPIAPPSQSPMAQREYKRLHKRYYIWNNTPYIDHVNNGLHWYGRQVVDRSNINFIQRGMARAKG